jgi:hypothetical protein
MQNLPLLNSSVQNLAMAEQKTVAGAKPTKPKAQSHTNFPRDALCIDKRKHSLILIGAMAVQIQKKTG